MNLVSYKRHRFAPDVICRVLGLSCKSYTRSAPLTNPIMPAQLDSALSTLEHIINKYAVVEAQSSRLLSFVW
jgi:hypothetical protein